LGTLVHNLGSKLSRKTMLRIEHLGKVEMTTPSELIQQSHWLNQLVVDRQTLEERGRVERLWMYPQAHRVLGIVCKQSWLGMERTVFQLHQIHAWGASGILVQGPPEKTTVEKVRQLESLLQHEVWSDEGNQVGKITDCLFHPKTGDITDYLFVSEGWASLMGEVYRLPPSAILSFGKKRVLIAEAGIAHLALYREGLPQKLDRAKEYLRDEATQEWRILTQQAEAKTEQAKERWRILAERAKEQAQRLTHQVRETAQSVNEQLKDNTRFWLEQARETSQTLADQVKDGTQTLGKQVEEGIQTLTVHAEEIFDSITEDEPSPSQSQPVDPDLVDPGNAGNTHHARDTNPTDANPTNADDIWDAWDLWDELDEENTPPVAVPTPADDDEDEPWI
jgi:uncharacterized protein YrrD